MTDNLLEKARENRIKALKARQSDHSDVSFTTQRNQHTKKHKIVFISRRETCNAITMAA